MPSFDIANIYRYQNSNFIVGIHLAPAIVCSTIMFMIWKMGKKNYNELNFSLASVTKGLSPKFFGLFNTMMWLICLFGFVMYLVIVPKVPLFALLFENASHTELGELREDSFKKLPVILLFFFQLLRLLGFPILAGLPFAQYLVTKKKFYFIIFILGLLLGLMFSLLSLAKSPPLYTILFSINTYIFIKGRINTNVIISSLIGFSFPILMAIYSYGIDIKLFFTVASDLLFRRTFNVSTNVLYKYFEAFPDSTPFLYGKGITLIEMIFYGEGFRLPNHMYHYMQYGNTKTGWANAAFVGSAWADFGWIGIIVYSIIVGWLIVKIHVYFSKYNKSIIEIPFMAFFALFFMMLPIQALTGTFFLLALPAMVIIHSSIRHKRRYHTLRQLQASQ